MAVSDEMNTETHSFNYIFGQKPHWEYLTIRSIRVLPQEAVGEDLKHFLSFADRPLADGLPVKYHPQ